MQGEILSMMREGASIKEVSAALGICRASLYNWKRQYPEFLDTIKRGETYSQAWWERQGRENLQNRNFNNHHWFRQMCNRFGWRNEGGPVEPRRNPSKSMTGHNRPPTDLTAQEWHKRYAPTGNY
tara:strand:- start:272 stop:646 length:375 start_codon:yes stop_codon:yes gene_type:complete